MLKTVGFPSTRTGDQTIVDGNLVIGTAGKGIDFSANTGAPGMTSELLDDYEEGTWTPVATPAVGTLTQSDIGSLYVKVGRLVTACGYINVSSIGSPSGKLTISGLPFGVALYTSVSLCFFAGGLTTPVAAYTLLTTDAFETVNFNSNTIGAGANLMFTVSYMATS
jgi:hypothetical protein